MIKQEDITDRKEICPDKSADLAHSPSNPIVLATNPCGARLACNKTDIVARTDLAKRKRDAIRNDKASNGRWLVQNW